MSYHSNFPLIWGFVFLHQVNVSSARYLRQNYNAVQLCIDLSRAKHGRFGKQTVDVTSDNAQWFRGHEEVAEGPCELLFSSEALTNREMKLITYCKHDGTASNGREYEIEAPRFLEDFLFDKGAARGECVDAELDNMGSYARHPQSGLIDVDVLCFDLEEYGMQTIGLDRRGARWFLRDGDVVSRGACNKAGEKLDRRETEIVTYCKHFGSIKDGYEWEIQAPRFLGDYLHDKRGTERGECSDVNSGSINANFEPDYFALVTGNNVKPVPNKNNNSKPKSYTCQHSRSNELACTCIEHNKNKPDKKMRCDCVKNSSNAARPKSGKKPGKKPGKDKPGKNKPDKNKPVVASKPKPKRTSKPTPSTRTPRPTPRFTPGPSPRPTPKRTPQPTRRTPRPNNTINSATPRPTPERTPRPTRPTPRPIRPNPVPDRTPRPVVTTPITLRPVVTTPITLKPVVTTPVTLKPINQGNIDIELTEDCSDCICDTVFSGFIQRPDTACKEFVQCFEGCVSQILFCTPGTTYDASLQVCNHDFNNVVCGQDPPCDFNFNIE